MTREDLIQEILARQNIWKTSAGGTRLEESIVDEIDEYMRKWAGNVAKLKYIATYPLAKTVGLSYEEAESGTPFHKEIRKSDSDLIKKYVISQAGQQMITSKGNATADNGLMQKFTGNLDDPQQALSFMARRSLKEIYVDNEEHRKLKDEFNLSPSEYEWSLQYLNGCATLSNTAIYDNPQVVAFITQCQLLKNKELVELSVFSKETCKNSLSLVLSKLLLRYQNPAISNEELIALSKEIRQTIQTMGLSVNLFPQTDIALDKVQVTNILQILGEKHQTNALDITKFWEYTEIEFNWRKENVKLTWFQQAIESMKQRAQEDSTDDLWF